MKLAQVAEGKAFKKPFSFERITENGKRTECKVLIEVITPHEQNLATIDAQNFVNSLDKNVKENRNYDTLLEDEENIHVLARALKDPDAPDEEWAGPEELRHKLKTDELALLVKAYEEHQQDSGAIVHKMTESSFESLTTAIAEAQSADPLLRFAPHIVRSCIVIMALRLVRSQMDRSLSSSNLSDSDSESSTTTSENSEPL